MEELAKIFKALSDANRIRILKMLEKRPLCVCEITDILDLAVSTVSKHLSILRGAGFIEAEKNGKWVDYKLAARKDNLQVNQILSLFPMWINEEDIIESDTKSVRRADRNVICQYN